MDADFCMSALPWGYIGNAENAVLVNIVFPSGCHRVLIFVRYDAYTMALRGLKKFPDGHTMGNDALTNGPMSSRSLPKMKLFIIVCPSLVKIG